MRRIHRLLFAFLPVAALCATATAQHTPDEALRALKEGNRRFAEGRSVAQPVGPGVRRTLARGQSPIAVIVTCADSRVPPEHLFNTGLGELIVVRTAGHVLGSEALATIEHAVERLHVPLCVVLGHEHCDVVTAAIHQTSQTDGGARLSPSIMRLLERIEPAVRKAQNLDLSGKQLHDRCEEEHAHTAAHEALRRSPLLRRYLKVGKFRMMAARYHAGGDVEWLPNRPLPAAHDPEKPILLGTIPQGLPPHVALRMLRAGHRRFLGDTRPAPDLTKERRSQLVAGQQPLAIVVTDSDSRVSPEHIFDAGIGELFVVRTAGNTMTDETLASIEFAAGNLGASLLVVMGHNRCESLVAAADHPEKQQLTPHQRTLLRSLEPTVATARDRRVKNVVMQASKDNVTRAVHEARSRSALLRQLEGQGRLAMLAGYYDVATGDLSWLKAPSDSHASSTQHAAAPKAHGSHDAGHGEAHASGHAPHANAGHGNAGHGNAGHGNTGHGNAGHGNAGHGNTGHGDTGHGDAGHGHGTEHHGDAEHGHADHGSSGHGDSHHQANGHDSHADHGLPVMDFHAAPAGETAAHGHQNAHGSEPHGAATHDGHGSHGTHASHGGGQDSHGSHESHDSHGHDAHDEHGHGNEPSPHSNTTNDLLNYLKNPVVVVGITGIASLLAAAMLVLRRRP